MIELIVIVIHHHSSSSSSSHSIASPPLPLTLVFLFQMYKIAFTVGTADEPVVIGASLPLHSLRQAPPYGTAIDVEISQRMVRRLAPDGKLRALFRFGAVAK